MAGEKPLLLILLTLAVLTRWTGLCYPMQVVWDEVHFAGFVNGYLTGSYFFDIHPPLGKLALAASATLGGYDGKTSWATIGNPLPEESVPLLFLRGLPALQGTLTVPLVYLTARELGLSVPAALLSASGMLFDVCALVESRYVLTDSTLLLAIILQLWASVSSDRFAPLSREWLLRTLLAGVAIGLAVGTKWTGLSTVAVAGVHSLAALWRAVAADAESGANSDPTARPGRSRRRMLLLGRLAKEAAARVMLLLCIPALMYVVSFVLHFALLSSTGDGARFMTPPFRATLGGDVVTPSSLQALHAAGAAASAQPLGFVGKFRELNYEMYRANSALKKGHGWGSMWYEWPLMMRTILFWIAKESPYRTVALPAARIYCMGTPFVWWAAALAPILVLAKCVSAVLSRVRRVGSPPQRFWLHALLLFGYLINWLPFILVSRVAFIYHFLPSLFYALLLIGAALDAYVPSAFIISAAQVDSACEAGKTASRDPFLAWSMEGNVLRWAAASVLIVLFASCFAFFAPLVYGTPMTNTDLQARFWMTSWE